MKETRVGRIYDVSYQQGDLTILVTLTIDDGQMQLKLPLESANGLITFMETGSKGAAEAITGFSGDGVEVPDLVDRERAFVFGAETVHHGPVHVFVEGGPAGFLITVVQINALSH